ncbi:MAG: PP2C family protein-serine/threonine phosphatase [bacterium]|nr:PP2C family protein-serine/threonine phosphatase [bacterium]
MMKINIILIFIFLNRPGYFMISLKELLELKSIPNDIELSREDFLALVKQHKGLLKENERNKAFWESTNQNLEKVTLQLEKTNNELREVSEQLWGEMELAKKIQTVLLPRKTNIEGYEIAAYMEPADEVGGDYYDIINVKGRDWIVIGDVSGHGVSAGLIMMMVQTSIHTVLSEGSSFLKPSELLVKINTVIRENIKKVAADKYMTITIFACLKEGEMIFSGLHEDIFIYRAKDSRVDYIETTGVWLGILDDINGMMSDSSLLLNAGDTMLIYTDGITESWKKGSVKGKRTPSSDMFGKEKLKDVLFTMGLASPEEIKNAILTELKNYKSHDDITMVVIRKL